MGRLLGPQEVGTKRVFDRFQDILMRSEPFSVHAVRLKATMHFPFVLIDE